MAEAERVTNDLVEADAEHARRGVRQHLGQVLVEQGVITPEQLEGALNEQKVVAAQGSSSAVTSRTVRSRPPWRMRCPCGWST
jgi:hypothetical protein